MTFKDCTTISLERTEVINPQFDYCPPELMDLFVTNVPTVPTQNSGGGHQPSYIYRFLADYYSPEDSRFDAVAFWEKEKPKNTVFAITCICIIANQKNILKVRPETACRKVF